MSVSVLTAMAISPTNNYRQHIQKRHTAELAYLAEGTSVDDVKALLTENAEAIKASLHKQGASNLSVFAMTDVNGKTLIVAHRNDPNKGKPTLLAWPKAIREKLVSHEDAARRRDGETTLLDMELICHLPCAVDKVPAGEVQRIGLVTELRPEMEEKYRTLHQTVWPAVIDQITRSNYRHWTTWCTEIGDKIYLIAYFEYVGLDLNADNADMGGDPTTIRWWKITDACQKPLPQQEGKGGMWAGMTPLLYIN